MENDRIIQNFGYTEMYEWVKVPQTKLGIFVQFSNHYPDKIEPYHGGVLTGVSTVCSAIESDDPVNWPKAYITDSVGDVYMKEEKLAVGIKQYDQSNEFSYMATRPWSHYVKIENPVYDKNIKYTKRTNRKEWVRINILGKVIVHDNGLCEPGKYCAPYIGDDFQLWGYAVPAESNSSHKFYVLSRVSKDSVMIINNSVANQLY